MFYAQNIVEELRSMIDIVDVISNHTELTLKGNNYVGLCPFHNEKTASFTVSRNKQMYYCFGCGVSGNVYTFLMEKERMSFVESIEYIADKVHYKLPDTSKYNKDYELKGEIYEIHKKVARKYYDNLTKSENGKQYLENRNISYNTIKKFGLGISENYNQIYEFLLEEGYDIETIVKSGLVIKSKSGNYFDRFRSRIMFPIIDAKNKVIGFGGRLINDNPKEAKYLNSPETVIFNKSKSLYGINFSKNSTNKNLILVEGYMDVISLFQNGYDNVVASLGTSFNDIHCREIRKYTKNVYILFDSDDAGIKATNKAIPILVKGGLKVKIVQLDFGKDPDEYIKVKGKEAFSKRLDLSQSHINFLINQQKQKYNLNIVEEKIDFIKNVIKILDTLESFEREVYAKDIAKKLEISEESLQSSVNKSKKQQVVHIKKSREYEANKAVVNAKKSIISILISNLNYYLPIKEVLKPHELNNKVYEKLLTIIYNLLEKKETILEADVISYFDNLEEQTVVSSIFSTSINFENEDVEKAVVDIVKIIKKDYFDYMLANETDISVQNNIMKDKRNLEKLYIKFN